MATDQSLERLFSLHPKLIDLSLGRIERLLAALGHPERKLPPVIHVAGTNGKGSVTAFLRSLIEAQGLTAQAYTSPHLVRFHERIRLSSGLIDEEALQQVLDEVEEVNAGQAITFFEATTVVAFQAFAADNADFCLLEVGLGGKYDATNVIEPPMATIITPVAMDHEGFLGNELAGIAEEKAGILKPGVPAFIARQDPVAMAVITRRAAEVGAPIFFAGRDWTIRRQDETLIYKDRKGELILPIPELAGAHQIDNAAVALACLRYMDRAGSPDYMASAMQAVRWPARLQPIEQGPLFDLRQGKGSLTLDGGHNVHAATALAQHFEGRKVSLVLGLMENREIAPILEVLAPIIGHLGAISIPGEASHAPADIAEVAIAMGLEAQAYDGVEYALAGLPDGDALIAGSLNLAGHVLELSDLLPK